MVFTGRFDHVIDEKGRLAIPASMRSQIRPEVHGEGFYLVQEKRYLQLVPERLFEHLASSVRGALLPKASIAKASRYFFANVFKLEPDKQGRVMIPDGFFRDSKNPDPLVRVPLDHDVTLVGNGDRIEIWNRPAFRSHMAEAIEDVDSFMDVLTELFGTMQPTPQFMLTFGPPATPSKAAAATGGAQSAEPGGSNN